MQYESVSTFRMTIGEMRLIATSPLVCASWPQTFLSLIEHRCFLCVSSHWTQLLPHASQLPLFFLLVVGASSYIDYYRILGLTPGAPQAPLYIWQSDPFEMPH